MLTSNLKTANERYVSLRPGLCAAQARSEACLHWDRKEIQRLGRWNTELAVYFARDWLLRYVAHRPSRPAADPARPTTFSLEEVVEDGLGDMVKGRLTRE